MMYDYDELVTAILDRIESEYGRLYWNKNHKEMLSPFQNTGAEYHNDTFSVHAYDWGDEPDVINFRCGGFCASWYKHSHRGLEYWSKDAIITAEYLNDILNVCLKSLTEDFER